MSRMIRNSIILVLLFVFVSDSKAQYDCSIKDSSSGLSFYCFEKLSKVDSYIIKNNSGLIFESLDTVQIMDIDTSQLSFIVEEIIDLELRHSLDDYTFQLVPFYHEKKAYLAIIGAETNNYNISESCERLNYVLGGDYYFILTLEMESKSMVKLVR